MDNMIGQTMEHSGQTWVCLGRGPNGYPLWPIDEMFARKKFKKTVENRIRRHYPNGKEEGSFTRGWNGHHQRIPYFYRDLVPVHMFVAKCGRTAYRGLPKSAFWRQGHRKAIYKQAAMEAGY